MSLICNQEQHSSITVEPIASLFHYRNPDLTDLLWGGMLLQSQSIA